MICRIKAQLFLFPSVQLLGKKALCYLKGFPFMLVGQVVIKFKKINSNSNTIHLLKKYRHNLFKNYVFIYIIMLS